MTQNNKISVISLIASVLATAILALKMDSPELYKAILALASVSLFAFAFIYLNPSLESLSKGLLFLFAAVLIAVAGGFFSESSLWVWVSASVAVVLIYLSRIVLRNNTIAQHIIIPSLFGLVFLGTASLLGNPGWGGYPALFAFFFMLGLLQTQRLESSVNKSSIPTYQNSNQKYDYHHHHQTLSWTSMIFFLFGLITLWPWLGKLYGNTYFWALVIGVHAPLVFFWGRLRQPKNESAFAALTRFNRIMPYVGFVLLVALVLA